ncbi:hypothetical protein Y032_0002g839 [Ancylostoma ceylanicum]|uniref:Lipocalin/cytosolic fatty-acid binding domain-containing protein n=1 Tax=Ancylostoma ceylanicum TaxID=53326 RepID=A0A016W106_9BILA|nr:hypothetical protein Y032_0002g839 [Ancylostoma ceylanicum]
MLLLVLHLLCAAIEQPRQTFGTSAELAEFRSFRGAWFTIGVRFSELPRKYDVTNQFFFGTCSETPRKFRVETQKNASFGTSAELRDQCDDQGYYSNSIFSLKFCSDMFCLVFSWQCKKPK